MKRVINGVTYNTDTATLIAQEDDTDGDWEGGGQGSRTVWKLYQTRGGAFFLHTDTVYRLREPRFKEWYEDERHSFASMTPEQAHEWVMEGEVELLNDVFGAPPEATAEEVLGATLYIRVPASLKERLEARAKDDGISLNSWVMRCVEQCAGQKRPRAKPASA